MVRRFPLLAVVVLAVLFVVPCAALAATPTMSLVDPITDNYKASYNADPSQPELRTWLALKQVSVSGTTWQPVVPSAIQVVSGGSIDVIAADGRQGRLVAQVESGPFGSPLWRLDPANASSGGRWGILATVTDRQTLATTPALVRLTLFVGTEEFGVGLVEYRYDAKFANAPQGNIEYNGPGGRWYVGGVATRSQEEAAPAMPPTLLAGAPAATIVRPRITRITMPLRTSKRAIALKVLGRAGAADARITYIRVRVGASSRWGAWIRTRAAYSVVLPRGIASHTVSIQLRDARGVSSLVSSRRVTCICG